MIDRNAIRSTLRSATLIALAAFGLHQLRYLIGYGSAGSDALSQQGHGYMATFLPEFLGVALVVLGATVAAVLLSPGSRASRSRSGSSDWLTCSLALFTVFCLQESLEGILSPGHPGGLDFLLQAGGWVALPLAMLLGALVVLVLKLLQTTDDAIIRATTTSETPRAPRNLAAPPTRIRVVSQACTLAFGFARRPPPLVS